MTVEGENCEVGTVCGGAGIYSHDAAVLELHDSRVLGNTGSLYGGGIYSAGRLVVANSELRDNQAQGSGGGVEADGVTEISNSIISGNVATRVVWRWHRDLHRNPDPGQQRCRATMWPETTAAA